jgi:hypothetical protein
LSRITPFLALLGLVLVVSACSPQHLSSGSGASSRSTTTRPARSTTPSTSTTTSPSLGYLTGYGATQAVWYQGHTADPDGGGFYPRLGNGDDTYTSVQFVNGRALYYTENLYPAVPLDQAMASVGDELPFDATTAHNAPSPTANPSCQQVVETSPTLSAAAGVDVLAELRSATPSLDTGAVTEITYEPLTGSTSSLPSC